MPDKLRSKITRRDFLREARRGGIIAGGTAIGVSSLPKTARSWDTSDCFTEHQKKTMECIADTAVPPTDDDDGPGASDAYAWKLMKDPFYTLRWISIAFATSGMGRGSLIWITRIERRFSWTERFAAVLGEPLPPLIE